MFRFFFTVFFACSFCVAALYNVVQLRNWVTKPTLGLFEDFNSLATSTQAERTRALEQVRDSVNAVGAKGDRALELAFVTRQLSRLELSDKNRISLLCEALSAVGVALGREPFDAVTLINWANLRQVLGEFDCKLPATAGDFVEVARLATLSDPNNAAVTYAASQVNFWASRSAEGERLLKNFLKFNGKISAGQRGFILSRISSAEDLLEIIPARFPQAFEWTRFIKEAGIDSAESIADGLDKLQRIALEAAISEYEQASVPLQVHLDRLFSTYDLLASDALRRGVDLELARVLMSKGRVQDRRLASYLSMRGRLNEVRSVKGFSPPDSQLKLRPLEHWNSTLRISFDAFYQSVGFYLPPEESLSLIELSSSNLSGGLEPRKIELLTSQDNVNWEVLPISDSVESFQSGSLNVFVIKVPQGLKAAFWKVAYNSPDRRNSFSNNLVKLIKAYGVSLSES